MTSRNLRILAAVVILLFGVMYALNTTDRSPPGTELGLIVPGLKAQLNDLETVTIVLADANTDDGLTLAREGDTWVVREKSGYPADTATLRQLLIAIAEANKVEQKTSNPSLYDRLGVQHPAEEGGDGVLVEGSAPDFSFALILGEQTQGDYRYARVPSEEPSWLIDRNPTLPADVSGWLQSGIIDIPSADVRSVEIRHADGETIRLHKETAEAGTYTVEEIPEGRELSYPTIVNSIAGTLGNLTLEDVARIEESGFDATANATFVTFDELRVDIATAEKGEQTWITVEAAAVPAEEPVAPAADGAEDAATPSASDEPEVDEAEPTGGPDATAEEDAGPTPAERAAAINARTKGWRYRIPGYKADQLTRRWEDILRAEETEDETEQ